MLSHYYTDLILRFSDLSSDQRSVVQNRELASVKDGSSVGYDNPGFYSPVDYLKSQRGPKFSSLELSPAMIGSEDPIICEGSTGVRRKEERLDSDSAFQEPTVRSSYMKQQIIGSFQASAEGNDPWSMDSQEMEYEQHASISWFKDKHKLIE